jgi:hypothetical protein
MLLSNVLLVGFDLLSLCHREMLPLLSPRSTGISRKLTGPWLL